MLYKPVSYVFLCDKGLLYLTYFTCAIRLLVSGWWCRRNSKPVVVVSLAGESIPIRLFLSGYELTPTMRDINKKFSVRYYLNLVLVDEEERRYFKQQVGSWEVICG